MNIRPYPNVRYFVIHQIFEKNIDSQQIMTLKSSLEQRSDMDIYTYRDQGLTKSRNLAITKSTADICLLADDDVFYLENALPELISVFDRHPDEDVIGFRFSAQKDKPLSKCTKNRADVSRLSDYHQATGFWSAQIAFRRESILDREIHFNERIGMGTNIPAGCETLFLSECFHNHLNIASCNLELLILNFRHQTFKERLHKKFFSGIVCARIYGMSMTLYYIRKYLFEESHPKNWLRLIYFLAGNVYYIFKGRTEF